MKKPNSVSLTPSQQELLDLLTESHGTFVRALIQKDAPLALLAYANHVRALGELLSHELLNQLCEGK